uniref:Uncharacterized protein n=1 Tax=Chlamydomonas euryale TaxID=1486919 RepID=A0A6U2H8D8_9CHLO
MFWHSCAHSYIVTLAWMLKDALRWDLPLRCVEVVGASDLAASVQPRGGGCAAAATRACCAVPPLAAGVPLRDAAAVDAPGPARTAAIMDCIVPPPAPPPPPPPPP